MRVLIIGGTKFMGPYVVRRLVEDGHEVAVFHRGETENGLPESATHIHGEKSRFGDYKAEFERFAPEVVLDMIAYTEEDARNLLSTFKQLARRVVVASSQDVYRAYGLLLRLEEGEPEKIPLNEDSALRTNLYPHRALAKVKTDFKYEYEKILVEEIVMKGADLECTVLRLPAVYGPQDPQHRLYGHLKRMDDGRPFILLAEDVARWRWTHGYVENVAAGIALAVTHENAAGRIYNIGEPFARTQLEWAQALTDATGWQGEVLTLPRERLPQHLQSKIDPRHHLVVDTSRIRSELGYNEGISPEESLRRSIEWERANPPDDQDPSQFDYDAEDEAAKSLAEV